MRYPNLEAEMARTGTSCEMLAKSVGVHPNTVRNWRADRAEPTVSAALAASDYFGVDAKYLFATEATTPSA